MDYLTHLYDVGLSWSSIATHKSTISMTMAPIDGVKIGDHPLIKRLMKGVFKERPSRRLGPTTWDPLRVFAIFHQWPEVLPLSKLIRKGVVLLSLATAKRASELQALLCDHLHFRMEGVNMRFVPSRLTKTDRPGCMTPPFYVKPWTEDKCLCPVETVRLIMAQREQLHLQHSALFFHWTLPHQPLDTAAIGRCIAYCLGKAGIDATPGSTRSVAASAALAAGASIGEVLGMGNWSRASTFFRYYHNL
jgi:hypothetical protein